ncbi:MAG: phosphatase PAP2 family protein [Bdellovibrio sp.]|nr:phosphatase PAP2 family protein [Bdellovibrio sp.]
MPSRHVSYVNSSSFESSFDTIQAIKRPWWHSLILLLLGTIGFAVPYLLSNWWNAGREFHFAPYLQIELLIPRVNWMIIPYVSAYLMGLASIQRLPYMAQKALMKAVNVAGIIGGIIFILFPTELGYLRTTDGLGFWRPVYEILWSLDHPYNLTPSMHVTMAYLMIVPVIQSSKSILAKSILTLWLFLVCISIVLVHQHHVIDFITGFVLGWLCDVYIYRPTVISYARDMVWSSNVTASNDRDRDAA